MKSINRLLVLYCIGISLSMQLYAQCDGSPQGEQLQVINPSFEGPPGDHITPNPWNVCGITPDTQPGSWGITLPASEGNTYVGFVQGGPFWLEGASQALSGNMVAGVEYTFTIDLAITNSNDGGIIPAPAQLVIHGANALCQRTELLWTSPVVNNLGWVTYTVTFTPTQNFSHIYFSISGNSPDMSYILLDNITPIVPNLAVLDITSHFNGMADGCSFILSGELSLPLADSIILTGAFIESPVQANINGIYFDHVLNFNVTGPQTIYARVYYVDPATGAHACSYDSVIVDVSSPIIGYDIQNHCLNKTANFIDTSYVLGVGSITSWNWDLGDGTTSTTTNPSHTYANPGRYDVTLEIEDQNGCATTLTKQVFVYPLPVADWSTASVCEGNQTVFNEQSTVAVLDNDAIVQWQWLFGDGGSSTAQNPTHAYNAENVYTGQLIVTTNHGCKDTFSNTATVWPLPQVDFSLTDACLGFLTNFQDLSVISNDHTPNTNVQWNWSFADPAGGTSTLQNPSYSYQQDGVFNVQLEVTSANGCVNSVILPVTVYPKPQASFSGINLSGCAPICAELTSTSIVNNPSSIVRYTWTLSDGTIYNSSSPTSTFCLDNETDSTVYYDVLLTVETDQGCVDSYSEQNYIAAYHNPVANFYANPGQVSTIDETTELVNESLYADSYLWNFGDGSPASTNVNPTHSFPNEQGGAYTITLIASTNEGCRDTTFITIKLLDELIFYIPNTFTPDGDDHNQTFLPVFTASYDKYDYNLYIFDRWGEMVFESHDASIGWDGTYGGKQCQQGTYTWKIEVKTLLNDERKSFVGHINLLR